MIADFWWLIKHAGMALGFALVAVVAGVLYLLIRIFMAFDLDEGL